MTIILVDIECFVEIFRWRRRWVEGFYVIDQQKNNGMEKRSKLVFLFFLTNRNLDSVAFSPLDLLL